MNNRNYWERGEYLLSGLVGATFSTYLYGSIILGLLVGVPVGILVGWSIRLTRKAEGRRQKAFIKKGRGQKAEGILFSALCHDRRE